MSEADEQGLQEMQALAERCGWKKVQAPIPWQPKKLGAELVGLYGGRTVRKGPFGQYDVIIMHVPKRRSYMVSGTRIIQLVDSAMLEPGDMIRVVFQGFMELADDKKMRLFDLYIPEERTHKDTEIPVTHGDPQ